MPNHTPEWAEGMKLREQHWMEGQSTARIFGPNGETITTVHDVRGDGVYLQERIVSAFNACAPIKTEPVGALAAAREALQSVLDKWDYHNEVTDSYCELCEGEAPKNKGGVPIRPVVHDVEPGGMDCPYVKVRTALEKLGTQA